MKIKQKRTNSFYTNNFNLKEYNFQKFIETYINYTWFGIDRGKYQYI